MVCIYCDGKTSVENSRVQKKSNATWRRRMCQQCHTVFTTRETIDYAGSIVVRKKTGHIEPFRRQKLFISVYDSLKHRKTALEDAEGLSDTIIGRLLNQQKQPEISHEVIISTTMLVLKRFDKVAAIHYKAFHL